MIVKMQKVHLIVQKKDVVTALDTLSSLGVLHVVHQDPLIGYELNEFREEVEALSSALEPLKLIKRDVQQIECKDWREPVNLVLELMAEIERYNEAIVKRDNLFELWDPWGNFDPEDIKLLSQKGIFIHLYKIKKSELKKIPDGIIWKSVFA